ncbi:hypothetical protein E1A91_D01G108300v1 [Gossypium mustelinum]|uniref:Uncharacterized protein n=1 Tax=Gossypium mustelinum TaxID=34275 RepID=A0A5D2W5X7_GOSMU|nr:hypothetical protein E1A91_D01G108300v1 [Gossypium mustelinum]
MEDVKTEIPPPSRFFQEHLNNFIPPSPSLMLPFLMILYCFRFWHRFDYKSNLKMALCFQSDLSFLKPFTKTALETLNITIK